MKRDLSNLSITTYVGSMNFSPAELLTVVTGSSVVAALVTQGVGLVRDAWKAKRDGKFSALYLAIALEAYADACATLVGDSQNHENSGGHAGTPHGNLAALPEYPSTIEWKPFGISDTTRALSFRVEVDTQIAYFDGYWEFGDEDEGAPLVRENAARFGFKALQLASDFRKSWGIEPMQYKGNWNVRDYLEEKWDDHKQKRIAYDEMQRKTADDMLASMPAIATTATE